MYDHAVILYEWNNIKTEWLVHNVIEQDHAIKGTDAELLSDEGAFWGKDEIYKEIVLSKNSIVAILWLI